MISTVRTTQFTVKRLSVNTHRVTYFPRWSLSSFVLHTIAPYIVLKSCWSHAKHSFIPVWTLRWSQSAWLDINSPMFRAFKSTEKCTNMPCKILPKLNLNLSFSHLYSSEWTPCLNRSKKGRKDSKLTTSFQPPFCLLLLSSDVWRDRIRFQLPNCFSQARFIRKYKTREKRTQILRLCRRNQNKVKNGWVSWRLQKTEARLGT